MYCGVFEASSVVCSNFDRKRKLTPTFSDLMTNSHFRFNMLTHLELTG